MMASSQQRPDDELGKMKQKEDDHNTMDDPSPFPLPTTFSSSALLVPITRIVGKGYYHRQTMKRLGLLILIMAIIVVIQYNFFLFDHGDGNNRSNLNSKTYKKIQEQEQLVGINNTAKFSADEDGNMGSDRDENVDDNNEEEKFLLDEMMTTKTAKTNNEKNTTTSFRMFWRECPFIRFSYHCQGEGYDQYIQDWRDSLLSKLSLRNNNNNNNNSTSSDHDRRGRGSSYYKDLLIVGNSHVGQLAEELYCLLFEDIIDFKATNLDTACLDSFSKHEMCDGSGEFNSCGMYLAVATIQQNKQRRNMPPFRVFLAKNHPYLFSGEVGIEILFEKMQLNASKLATVVLGGWNGAKWAKYFLSSNFSTHATPSFDKECGGQSWDKFRPQVPDVVSVLKRHGFHGRILKYMFPQDFPSHDSLQCMSLPFPGSKPERSSCFVENCAPEKKSPNHHLCVPGYSVFPAVSALIS